MLRRLAVLLSPIPLLLAIAAAPAAAAAAPPSSMASLGDSITRGFNACGWYVDCASRSWSTGDNTAVNSHYLRIRAKNPAIDGKNYNDSQSGADSSGLLGQAQSAVGQNVGYVTILIGANDACRSSEAAMTSVATFRSRIDAALGALKAGLPSSQVFIASIPDLRRLWSIGKGNWAATGAWGTFGICKAMLANPTSTSATDTARRDRVRQRVIDFNTELAAACTAYGANCRFDNNAVFNYPFVLSQVSTWDYFHPNATGQQVLAGLTYAQGFGW